VDRYLVVSSDGHAGPHAADYREYVDPEHRAAFDVALPMQIAATEAAAKMFLVADINKDWRAGNEDGLHGAWDSDARDRVLDEDGVAVEVLFPDGVTEMNAPPFGAGFSMQPEGAVPELQWAGCRAHNRWMAEFVAMSPERRIGLGCIPIFWDIEQSVEGVRWCHENGLRGVVIPPVWGKQPAYHHPRYDPVWEVCEQLGMVIHFHSGPSPFEEYFGTLPRADDATELPGAVGAYVTEVAIWLVRPLTFMLWGGVFERYPKLKVAMTEGTSIWVPEYLELLEQRYSVTHYSQKLGDYRSHLSMSPADYFRRNVRVGASCMPRREAELRYEIGVDSIMWGSDYPHPEGAWPFTRQQMHDTMDGLPEDEIGKMLGENAAEFYALDTEKLAPIVARVGPEKSSFQSG
jgi:predicted TIM-barrel fold metal-dependent hydrolase